MKKLLGFVLIFSGLTLCRASILDYSASLDPLPTYAGAGAADFTLDTSSLLFTCVDGQLSGLSAPFDGVGIGFAGLYSLPPNNSFFQLSLNPDHTSGSFSGSFTLTPSQASAIENGDGAVEVITPGPPPAESMAGMIVETPEPTASTLALSAIASLGGWRLLRKQFQP